TQLKSEVQMLRKRFHFYMQIIGVVVIFYRFLTIYWPSCLSVTIAGSVIIMIVSSLYVGITSVEPDLVEKRWKYYTIKVIYALGASVAVLSGLTTIIFDDQCPGVAVIPAVFLGFVFWPFAIEREIWLKKITT